MFLHANEYYELCNVTGVSPYDGLQHLDLKDKQCPLLGIECKKDTGVKKVRHTLPNVILCFVYQIAIPSPYNSRALP